MESGKSDFFETGKFWLNYRNSGIQIIVITGCADASTMLPFDSKENRQKNKTQTGLERPKITEKEGNEVQVASMELHYQVKYFYLQPNHRLRVSCHLDLRLLPTLTQDSDRPDQSSFALHFPSKLFSLFCQPGPFDTTLHSDDLHPLSYALSQILGVPLVLRFLSSLVHCLVFFASSFYFWLASLETGCSPKDLLPAAWWHCGIFCFAVRRWLDWRRLK